MYAADQGHEACARALLQARANTELCNKHGATASQVPEARQHHELATLIEQHARNRKAQKQALAHTAREIAAVRAQAVAVRAQAAQAAQEDADMVALLAHLAKGQAARSKKSLAQRAASVVAAHPASVGSQLSQAPAAAAASQAATASALAAPAAPAAPAEEEQAGAALQPTTYLRRRRRSEF